MSSVTIIGEPLAVFTFDFIPSWNQVVNNARAHWSKGHKETKEWRTTGFNLAHRFMWTFFGVKKLGRKRLVCKRALVVIKVFRGTEGVYDVHNVCFKHLADGFTDAGIWRDDDWASVPMVIFMWAGNVPFKEQRTEIEIHELDFVVASGHSIPLPAGRVVNVDYIFG